MPTHVDRVTEQCCPPITEKLLGTTVGAQVCPIEVQIAVDIQTVDNDRAGESALDEAQGALDRRRESVDAG
jgi:hypothetical protein